MGSTSASGPSVAPPAVTASGAVRPGARSSRESTRPRGVASVRYAEAVEPATIRRSDPVSNPVGRYRRSPERRPSGAQSQGALLRPAALFRGTSLSAFSGSGTTGGSVRALACEVPDRIYPCI